MTQERKDELYDQLIAWICAHTHSDEERFQVLHGEFGMTQDELHDHCIESLDSFFPEESPLERLERRIAENYREYKERWLRMKPSELIANCGEIEAVTRMASELSAAIRHGDAEYLLRFRNPLEVVSDEWLNRNGIDSLNVDDELGHLLWSLQDRGVDETVYALAPEYSKEEGQEAAPMAEPQRKKETEAEVRERFYDELRIGLAQGGFTTGEEENGLLPVYWQDAPLCRVTAGCGIQYRKEEVDREGGSEALDTVIDLAATTAEYMRLLEAAPPLKAQGLEEDYRLLADFNGAVLAAHPTDRGTEFVTWEWDYPHTGMWQGHYYGTNYVGAKQDFALRSGLIPKTLLFEPQELEDLYRSCQRTLDLDETLTYLDAERLTDLQDRIEALSPGVGERVEALLRTAQEQEPERGPQMGGLLC